MSFVKLIRNLPAISVAAAALAFPAPIFADEFSADTVVLKVNDREITLGQIIQTRETLPEQYQSYPDDVLLKGIVDQLTRQSVLADAGPAAPDTRINVTLENQKIALLADRYIARIAEQAVSEDAVKSFYEETYAAGTGAQEYNASHILVKTEEEAAALVQELKEGADFATLAKERSTGPSGPSGGELGWFGEGMMVGEFEAAVKELKKGEISAPVQTQFGWHVIILNDAREAPIPTIDEVRVEIEQTLQGEAVNAAIDALVAKASIDASGLEGVDPALIRASDLLE